MKMLHESPSGVAPEMPDSLAVLGENGHGSWRMPERTTEVPPLPENESLSDLKDLGLGKIPSCFLWKH